MNPVKNVQKYTKLMNYRLKSQYYHSDFVQSTIVFYTFVPDYILINSFL